MTVHQQKPTRQSGNDPVRYLDGSALLRPLDLQKRQLLILGIFVIAALVIGGTIGFKVIDGVIGAPSRAAATVEENLSKPIDLALPSAVSYTQLDDATIRTTFTEAGYTIYDATSAEMAAAGVGMDLLKLPAGVDTVEAGLLYTQGISNLSAADAARLLNGSWRMTVDRSGANPDFRIRYADFTSMEATAAIQAAIVANGLEGSALGEAGVDAVGNTYQMGTIDSAGTIYSWQISVCPLSGVYSVSGLPETALYVGVHIYI